MTNSSHLNKLTNGIRVLERPTGEVNSCVSKPLTASKSPGWSDSVHDALMLSVPSTEYSTLWQDWIIFGIGPDTARRGWRIKDSKGIT